MKPYRIAIVMLGGLLAAYLLHRAVEAPAPSPAAADAPAAPKASGATPVASAAPRAVATPASAPVATRVEPVPAARSTEAEAPATAVTERMLIAGDALAGNCALETIFNAGRFSDLLQALRREVAGDTGVEAQRRAITEAYREAFTLSGGGARLIDVACGAHLCAVDIRLPANMEDDEVREAMVRRLLSEIAVVGTQVVTASIDGAPREARRIFSVSQEVSRLGNQPCSE